MLPDFFRQRLELVTQIKAAIAESLAPQRRGWIDPQRAARRDGDDDEHDDEVERGHHAHQPDIERDHAH